jgi:hypothetical protein
VSKQEYEKKLQEYKDKIIEAIGWAYADCCVSLDKGEDPRKNNMPEVLERAKKDLQV